MAVYKTEISYKYAAEVLECFLDWRNGKCKMSNYADIDDALKTAINVLHYATENINAIPSDADIKIENIRSILNG